MTSDGSMGHPFAFAWAGFILDGADGFGCRWTTEVADGWFDAAPVRSSSGQSRAGQDGDWPETPQRGARLVKLAGKVRTDEGLAVLELGLRRLGAVPVVGELLGDSPALTLSGAGQIEDAPVSSLITPGLATWQVTVKLPDPLLYGPATFDTTGLEGVTGTGRVWPRVWPRDWGVTPGQTPGSVAVPNAGTAPYWPTLRIDGPVPNPVITLNETGDWLRYNGTLTAGQWLEVDCANRRVRLNGQVPVTKRVSFSGRYLAIPVGGGSLSWVADGASPDARLSVFAREGAW